MQKAQREQEKIKATPEGSRLSGASLCCTNFTRPTGNLDSRTTQEVLGLLKLTGEQFHQTIVMITHNEALAQLCDRIIHIEDGRIVGGRDHTGDEEVHA